MIQKILFPVDFSPSLVGMAVYVKRAAAIFGAEVTLVHVFDLSSHDGYRVLRTNARREYLFRRSWGMRDLTYSLIRDSPCPVMSV